MYNTINIMNTAVCYTRKLLRVNPKGPHHEIFFYFFNFVSIYDDGCSLNLSRQSFHDVCKSNHYAVYLKLIQCCMSIISQ